MVARNSFDLHTVAGKKCIILYKQTPLINKVLKIVQLSFQIVCEYIVDSLHLKINRYIANKYQQSCHQIYAR